ncbi:MAG: hypothetical protein IJM08_03655 [Firmicutes bacterium]|nr:hypothetical protein [Bacillota bacterium]
MKVLARFIDTIVVFRGENRPLPYKFRFKDDKGESRELFVDSILMVSEQTVAGVTSLLYECQSDVDGEMKRYQLRYIVPQCKWMIYKF